MRFDSEKQKALNTDRSKKGSIDEKIIPLLEKINAKPDHYTTSSCSGRILVMKYGKKKNQAKWLFSSHEPIQKLPRFKEKGILWLKVDPMIVHVCCRGIESANRLLRAGRTIFRRAGVISIARKTTVEIQGSEKMEMPIMHKGKLLYSEQTISLILHQANLRLKRAHRQIRAFEKIVESL
ncbi:MAG TPA: tRNA wybutosine-synthesizing 3 family protein [Candidatus Nanoarchaeia archaeon]|nr:tRNA wybutosine-synthesizing 3 family protein [Candidatus Nanoarchaeia archaeon]